MSNFKTEILSYEAGEDLVAGDIVYLYSDSVVKKISSVEATNAIGMVQGAVSDGDQVAIVAVGIVDGVRVLVEDTDSSSGYDVAIVRGTHLVISGKAAGTYTAGQALSASTGTGVTTANATTIVAKALEAVAGVTTGDTYTTIKAYVKFL